MSEDDPAQSENFFGAPGRPDGDGRHASVASSESQSVTSPRCTKAFSRTGLESLAVDTAEQLFTIPFFTRNQMRE